MPCRAGLDDSADGRLLDDVAVGDGGMADMDMGDMGGGMDLDMGMGGEDYAGMPGGSGRLADLSMSSVAGRSRGSSIGVGAVGTPDMSLDSSAGGLGLGLGDGSELEFGAAPELAVRQRPAARRRRVVVDEKTMIDSAVVKALVNDVAAFTRPRLPPSKRTFGGAPCAAAIPGVGLGHLIGALLDRPGFTSFAPELRSLFAAVFTMEPPALKRLRLTPEERDAAAEAAAAAVDAQGAAAAAAESRRRSGPRWNSSWTGTGGTATCACTQHSTSCARSCPGP